MSNSNFTKNNKGFKRKSIIMSLPVIISGVDGNGNEYDVDSCKKIISDLQDAGVFSKLSVTLGIDKGLIGVPGKGTFSIARLQSIDVETGDASIMFFTKTAEYMDLVKDLVIVPRVRTGRDSTEVNTIFRFDIVRAMDA